MNHRLLAAVVALGLVPLVVPGTLAQKSEIGGRSVYVSVVTGRQDQPVTGLVAANFTVREDNQNREVLRVAPAPPPTHVTVLIDDGRAIDAMSMVQDMRKMLPGVFRQAFSLLPGAAVSYWTLGEPPTRRVNFTTNISAFDAALAVYAGRPGPGTSVSEAVYLSAGELRGQNAARPVIIAFLAEDNAEVATRESSTVETAMKAARASLWSIVLQQQMRSSLSATPPSEGAPASGRGMSDMTLGELTDRDDPDSTHRLRDRGVVLGDITKRSGGVERRTGSKQDLGPMFARVLTMIASRYEVTYARPASTATYKKLEVRLKGKSGNVAAPEWVVP